MRLRSISHRNSASNVWINFLARKSANWSRLVGIPFSATRSDASNLFSAIYSEWLTQKSVFHRRIRPRTQHACEIAHSGAPSIGLTILTIIIQRRDVMTKIALALTLVIAALATVTVSAGPRDAAQVASSYNENVTATGGGGGNLVPLW